MKKTDLIRLSWCFILILYTHISYISIYLDLICTVFFLPFSTIPSRQISSSPGHCSFTVPSGKLPKASAFSSPPERIGTRIFEYVFLEKQSGQKIDGFLFGMDFLTSSSHCLSLQDWSLFLYKLGWVFTQAQVWRVFACRKLLWYFKLEVFRSYSCSFQLPVASRYRKSSTNVQYSKYNHVKPCILCAR